MSGNNERPDNKKFVKIGLFEIGVQPECYRYPMRFRFGFIRYCPICNSMIDNIRDWNVDNKVCNSCYNGEIVRRRILTEDDTEHIIYDDNVYEDDDDEW